MKMIYFIMSSTYVDQGVAVEMVEFLIFKSDSEMCGHYTDELQFIQYLQKATLNEKNEARHS